MSLTFCQQAFDNVSNLLVNFKNDVLKEQADADVRNDKDKKDCDAIVGDAVAKEAQRLKDVNDLSDHIAFLTGEQDQQTTDRNTRKDRIQANKDLLKKFKEQRCENNLIFVKNLREHMEAIDILSLLRRDIQDYFASKQQPQPDESNTLSVSQIQTQQKVNTLFIERFAEFAHLLPEEKKMVFTQLAQVVTQLPDASSLSTPSADSDSSSDDLDSEGLSPIQKIAYQQAADYYAKLEQKILAMIDALIAHLRASRDELTKNEIHAAEDFAVFQTNIEKENEHLKEKIADLDKSLLDLANQLNVANVQLLKRKALLAESEEELSVEKKVCKEKSEYYARETDRRSSEVTTLNNASDIFNNILAKLSARVRARADAVASGATYADTDNLTQNVVNAQPAVTATVDANVATRNAVSFF